MEKEIKDLAAKVQAGAPIGTPELMMVPIVREVPSGRGYVTLSAALAAGTIEITELQAGATVPYVSVCNRGPQPVLMLDGAALVGARQNRILNLTVLVPARATLKVPVSCVEQGRWSSTSPLFDEGKEMLFATARGAKLDDVSQAMDASGGQSRASEQLAVWAAMDEYKTMFRAAAPTGAMQDVYRSVSRPVDDLVGPLKPVPGQVGAAFVSGLRWLGLELFDAPATLAAELPKIVRSYAADVVAMAAQNMQTAVHTWGTTEIVEELVQGRWQRFAGVGLGMDLRLGSERIAAGALAWEGEVVHLVAFPRMARNDHRAGSATPPMPNRRH